MANIFAFMFSACYIFILFTNILYAYRFADEVWEDKPIEGRYTRDVSDYQLLVPRKVDHQGSFVSYSLPNFFHQDTKRRRREARLDDEKVHYGIHFDGSDHVVELWPNHGLLSPGFVVETRASGAASDLNKVKIRSVDNTQCFYFGRVKGQDDSRVALSLCSGLSGHIRTKRAYYFIEPVKGHEPKKNGHHLHVIYKRSADNAVQQTCGNKINWEAAWLNRLEAEYRQRNGPDTDLRADFAKRLSIARGTQENYLHKRAEDETVYYMETLVVADKKFLQARNGTDYEQYLFTIANMASDIFHDDSVGHPFDLTLVRVIYLEKEEDEIDLTINRDADETLTSFCKWSTRINPLTSHPNHHDIAILVTKHDICAGADDCGAVGLANIAGCCQKGQSCAICEDTGLVVGTVMAHEVGHLLGSDHDSDDDDVPPPQCSGSVGKYDIHVMASWSQVSPANWSTCSREAITEFLEQDMGSCLLDEPQDHDFKFPKMPPGVVYDREWQCRDYYGPTKPCDLGPDRNCVLLSCKATGSKKCQTKGPPADGTSCGNNKWCYENKCVEIGVRPGSINGEWGEWGSWTKCTRSCGGGAHYMERKCDNPRPANSGRYCVGKSRRYKLCNEKHCESGAPTFREVQCREHNIDDVTWAPFNDGKPEHACKLMCLSNKNMVKTLERRVKDGTSCKRGTKNKCIAGKCRNVGCDLVLDSDAVEDICGVCNGDSSTCEIKDGVFTEDGEDYQKIVDLPAGSRQITVEEMNASNSFIAVASGDGKTFYLNGNHEIDVDGETEIGGSISVYTFTNENPRRESLFIAGPTKEKLRLYILHSKSRKDHNPGIKYRFSIPSKSSDYETKLSWELVSWSTCSAFCGGGTQFSEPSCIEEKGGKVSKVHCDKFPKPEVTTRACNQQSCRIRWRTGKWGECSGCKNKPGTRRRVVDCVKQSPFEDSEVIIEDSACKKDKPSGKEDCIGKLPCRPSKRQAPLEGESAYLEELSRYGSSKDCHQNPRKMKPKQGNCNPECCEEDKEESEEEKCDDEDKNEETDTSNKDENKKEWPSRPKSFHKTESKNEGTNKKKPYQKESDKKEEVPVTSRKKGLAVDKLSPNRFRVFEIPMSEDVNDFSFSDEAYETVAGNVASNVNMTEMEEKKGKAAMKTIQDSKKENVHKHMNEDDEDDVEYMETEGDKVEHKKGNEDTNENEYEHMNENEYEHMNENEYEHMDENEYEHVNEDRDEYENENEHENGNEY
jgi:hypothetical protein